MGLNAIRSNPNLVGHSITALTDNPLSGNGLMDAFGQIKPGVGDAIRDGFAPLRWCLFAEPYNIYRAASVRIEAVLANEDVLSPGDYQAHIQVIGPDSRLALNRMITVTIPHPKVSGEPPLAMQVFGEDVMIDGPSGSYRFVASFEEGALSTGGGAIFNVMDASEMPPVNTEVVLWGEDEELANWLRENGIRTRPFNPKKSDAREVILVSNNPESPGGEQAFRDLARRIGQGSSVVFLSPKVFRQVEQSEIPPSGGEQATRFLPLRNKGTFERRQFDAPCFKADKWAKKHPIFNGLPAGGLMDPIYYREIIPEFCWMTEEVPTEAVSGVIHTSFLVRRYLSGLFVSVHELGAGRFILNMLNIREKLGKDPGAERLLRNMLVYAGRDLSQPPWTAESCLSSFREATGRF